MTHTAWRKEISSFLKQRNTYALSGTAKRTRCSRCLVASEGHIQGERDPLTLLPEARPIEAARKQVEDSLKYKATLGNGFSLHIPMVSIAMARLGASEEEIKAQSDYVLEKFERYKYFRIEDEKVSNLSAMDAITEENWLVWCNNASHNEQAFRTFWYKQITLLGQEAVVNMCTSQLTDAVHSRLHHGPIRLAYAMDLGSKKEVAAALAAWCCNYKRLPAVAHKTVSPTVQHAFQEIQHRLLSSGALRELISAKGGFAKKYWKYSDDPCVLCEIPAVAGLSTDSGLQNFVYCVLDFYLQKPNILSLHMVTGLHALLVLRPYYTSVSFEKALHTHWCSLGILYLCRKAPPLPELQLQEDGQSQKLKVWDELTEHVLKSKSDHDIKFLDTCLYLGKKYPDLLPHIRAAASTLMKGRK